MVDIYSESPEQDSYFSNIKSNLSPEDVPESAVVEPGVGTPVYEPKGFTDNFTSGFTQAYRSIGLGSYTNYERQAYSELFDTLKKGGHLEALGISPILKSGETPESFYNKNKDKIDSYINNNPDYGILTPAEIEDKRVKAWRRDAKEASRLSEANSFISSGSVGALAGGLFGALTDPLNLVLSLIPIGNIAKGVSIASQLPKILGQMTAVSGAVALESKPRDLQYRKDIAGENISNVNVAKEIAVETLAGGVIGTGIVGLGAAVARLVSRSLPEFRIKLEEASKLKPEEYSQAIQQLSEEAQAKLGDIIPNVGRAILDNPDETLKYNYFIKSVEESEGGGPVLEVNSALSTLERIGEELSLKPEGITDEEFSRGILNARASIEAPLEINSVDVQGLSPDNIEFVNSIRDDTTFRFSKDDIGSEIQTPEPQGFRPLSDSEIKLAVDNSDVSKGGLIDREFHDIIDKFTSNESNTLIDYEVDGLKIGDYLKAFKEEEQAAADLATCLMTIKPRIRM